MQSLELMPGPISSCECNSGLPLAVTVFAEIERTFRRRVRSAETFRSTSPELSAGAPFRNDAYSSESLLVGLQPRGSRFPIYWMASPEEGGDGFSAYRKLVDLLGSDQPSFGIRMPDEPCSAIQELAGRCATEIGKFQASGPYLLAGLGCGGNIAFEVARQIHQQGRTVGLLVLIETAVLHAISTEPTWTRERMRPSQGSGFGRERNVKGAWRDFIFNILRKSLPLREAIRSRGSVMTELTSASLNANAQAMQRCRALIKEAPQQYPGRLTLFRTRTSILATRDPTLGWGEFAEKGVAVNVLPGPREEIFEEPVVHILAGELKACLAESRARQSAADAPQDEPESSSSQAKEFPSRPQKVVT
jgi:thioesterase domain-containing protein